MSLPTPRLRAAVRAGGVTPKFPARALTWETKGRETVTQTLEQEEHEEATRAPGAPETVPDTENDDDDGNGGDEPGDEPAAVSGPPVDAAKEQRRIAAALKREKEAHDKKLEKILGPAHEDVLPCLLCGEGLQGYVFPGDGQMFTDEERAMVLAFLGMEGEAGMPQTPGTETCTNCDGYGETKNPTKSAHYLTSQCAPCGGQGYIKRTPPPATVTNLPHVVTQADAAQNGVVGPCPLCLAPNSAGRPHFCNPVAQGVT